MEGHHRPVGDYASDANGMRISLCGGGARDQILDCSSIEELDVGEREDAREQGGCEERLRNVSTTNETRDSATYSMLHNDKVTLVLVGNTNVVEESLGRLAHDHGAEELTTEPGTASRGDASLDNCNLQVGTLLAKHIRSAQPAGTRTDDNNVGLGVVVKVRKVAAGYINCQAEMERPGLACETYSWHARPGTRGWEQK